MIPNSIYPKIPIIIINNSCSLSSHVMSSCYANLHQKRDSDGKAWYLIILLVIPMSFYSLPHCHNAFPVPILPG